MRTWPEERPYSRQFSRPFSRVPMSFKRHHPLLRQATNVLRGSAPTSRPLPLARLSSRGLTGQPIARRVESRALYPQGRQPMGRRIWLPRRGSPNPPFPKNQQRRRGLASCLGCASAPFVLLSSARLVPPLRCVGACVFSHCLPATQLANHSSPFMFFPPCDFPFLPESHLLRLCPLPFPVCLVGANFSKNDFPVLSGSPSPRTPRTLRKVRSGEYAAWRGGWI